MQRREARKLEDVPRHELEGKSTNEELRKVKECLSCFK